MMNKDDVSVADDYANHDLYAELLVDGKPVANSKHKVANKVVKSLCDYLMNGMATMNRNDADVVAYKLQYDDGKALKVIFFVED